MPRINPKSKAARAIETKVHIIAQREEKKKD